MKSGTCYWKFTKSIDGMQPYFDTSCDERWIVWEDEPVSNILCPYCNREIWFEKVEDE